MLYIFWGCIGILVYHLFIFGLLLAVFNRLFRKVVQYPVLADDKLPTITVICAAFNEETWIGRKIESFLALDYPKDKIKMLIISDDSTDRTHEIVEQYTHLPQIELIIQKPRRGKQSAHNLVEPDLDTDYVLSTDANTVFDPQSVRLLANAICSDPRIGVVSGELQLRVVDGTDSGEGLYWKYESLLKRLDSNFYTIIGANGAIYLIKREYFRQVDPASVDDFERTLIALKAGAIAKYVPEATAYEYGTTKATEEMGRKTRIITQEWFALLRNASLLNPFAYCRVSFIFVSHKLIRWMLPFFSIGILIANMGLLSHWFYVLTMIGQLFVYGFGVLELSLQKRSRSISAFRLMAYWVAMNAASAQAFIDFLIGKKYATWKIER